MNTPTRAPTRILTSAVSMLGLLTLVGLANGLYAALKVLPVRDRVVFISRQSNNPPSDFRSLATAIEARPDGTSTIILARRLGPSFWAGFLYVGHFARQMYYLATSRFVVLDSYCIAVSILSHRDSLRVVQIWHGLGAFKKFGLSAVSRSGYYRQRMAKLFKMHKGYDTVLVSSEAARVPYSEAMGVRLDQVEVCPLPRVDDLINPEWLAKTRNEIFEAYPDLAGSKIALWAPTLSTEELQENDDVRVRQLRHALAEIGFQLVEIPHPLDPDAVGEFKDRKHQFSAHQWLAASDVFITDQSSLLVEAAVLGLQLFLYVDDLHLNGICDTSYLDSDIIRSLARPNSAGIVRSIVDGHESEVGATLREKYVQVPAEKSCTEMMAQIILNKHSASKIPA